MTAAVLALFTAAPATAQDGNAPGVYRTGEQVYKACTSRRQADLIACDWFLMGAHDMAAMARDTGLIDRDSFCVPPGIDIAELRRRLIDRWRENEDSRRFSAVSATLNALVASYPGACKPAADQ